MSRLVLSSLMRRWPLKVVSRYVWPRACVLAYHRVAAPQCDPFGQCVTPANFADHLRALRQDYTVMALDELVERLPRGAYSDRTVAVTFDDGYVDNYTTAYPLAAHFEIPLTIFVTVAPVMERKPFWWDQLAVSLLDARAETLSLCIGGEPHHFTHHTPSERSASALAIQRLLLPLNEEERAFVLAQVAERGGDSQGQETLDGARPLTVAELQQLAKLPNVQIGAHTMNHPRLSNLSEEGQHAELRQSRLHLMELTGQAISLISYPFGKATDISPATAAIAAAEGYGAAFMTTPRPLLPGMALYTLPRLTVHDWPVAEFKQRLGAIFG
jgi:peptidoglycan/xylan/chitin deacetylase (PgdA/CDA1 family)